jgi:hypothetical protein
MESISIDDEGQIITSRNDLNSEKRTYNSIEVRNNSLGGTGKIKNIGLLTN